MSTNIEAIEEHFRKLAEDYPPMKLVADELRLAANMNRFLGGPAEINVLGLPSADTYENERLPHELRCNTPKGLVVFEPGQGRIIQSPCFEEGQGPVMISKQATRCLVILIRSQGIPVSREALLRNVLGYEPTDDMHTVYSHIHNIRIALGDKAQEIIKNRHGIGWYIPRANEVIHPPGSLA